MKPLDPALENLRIVEVVNQPDVVTALAASINSRLDNTSRGPKLYHERDSRPLYERQGREVAIVVNLRHGPEAPEDVAASRL